MPKGIVAIERTLISRRFDVYRRFLESLEPHTEETLRNFEQSVEEQARQIEDEEGRNDFYEYHSDEYSELNQFKVILMNSFFAASFALFEHSLVRICLRADR